MNNAKERLLKLIDEIPESEVADVLDFAEHLRERPEMNLFREMNEDDKEILIQYWDSDIYDEVWKDI
ncbi:DUF2281 domain-containing protein [Neobacillus sp. LXY-4]|uniref:DUF2281 domain-containing protein n=1 Tax=Neobacillus sp. LXY-4 TaxID=3379826 RepID=UPI003EE2F1C2